MFNQLRKDLSELGYDGLYNPKKKCFCVRDNIPKCIGEFVKIESDPESGVFTIFLNCEGAYLRYCMSCISRCEEYDGFDDLKKEKGWCLRPKKEVINEKTNEGQKNKRKK